MVQERTFYWRVKVHKNGVPDPEARRLLLGLCDEAGLYATISATENPNVYEVSITPGRAAHRRAVDRVLANYAHVVRYYPRVAETLGPRRARERGLPSLVFEWAALLTPRRIRVEDVGDAQEQLERLVDAGASRTRIAVYVVAQLFYIGVNTAGYVVAKLSPFFGGKSSEG